MKKLSEHQFRMLNELRMIIQSMKEEFIDNPSYENFIKDLQVFDESNFDDIESILEDNLNDTQF